MMKKLFYIFAAFALILLSGSCQREDSLSAESSVHYTISLPDVVQTKAAHDVYDLHYSVYRIASNGSLVKLYDHIETMTGNTAEITLDILNDQSYKILFWADAQGSDYYDCTDLENVTVNTVGLKSNNEDRDAFCGRDIIIAHDNGTRRNVELTRPFAQLNIATLVPQVDYDIDPDRSLVRITRLPLAYNVESGKSVASSITEVTFGKADVPSTTITSGTNVYQVVAMNYIFVPEENLEVSYEIETPEGTVTNTISNVPVSINHRTNIVGSLLTSDISYSVDLLEGFDNKTDLGQDFLDSHKVHQIYDVDDLVYANEHYFAEGGHFILMSDIDMSGVQWQSKAQPNASEGKIFIFDGNGKKISNWETSGRALFVPTSTNWKDGQQPELLSVSISNVTLSNCEVTTIETSAALFVAYAASNTVKIDNCHIENCSVSGPDYVGGFIGWNNYHATISASSVRNSTFNGGGSTGAFMGHAVAAPEGVVTITDAVVEGCEVKGETLEKSGIVLGTANIGTTTITTASISSNKVFDVQNSTAIVGRAVLGSDGSLTINGNNINSI
ncbi:MAG: hypothetical protein J6A22_03580 [Bacteroidales bacterium]|nr:hypothetical protein [Bacteroidales bacterium]